MKILFICTHNRCRSILAEAITNHISNGKIEARSAGSQPVGKVHPLTIKYLFEAGIEVENLKSQSWDAYKDWAPDVVITVCDSANGEECPLWFGNSIRVHWGLADPSKVEGSEEKIEKAFKETIFIIRQRINELVSSDLQNFNSQEKEVFLTRLGQG